MEDMYNDLPAVKARIDSGLALYGFTWQSRVAELNRHPQARKLVPLVIGYSIAKSRPREE